MHSRVTATEGGASEVDLMNIFTSCRSKQLILTDQSQSFNYATASCESAANLTRTSPGELENLCKLPTEGPSRGSNRSLPM